VKVEHKKVLCEINWSRQLRQAECRHGKVLIGSHSDSWHTMHSFNEDIGGREERRGRKEEEK